MAYNYRSLFLTFLETVKVQDLEASTAGSGESPLSVSDGQLLIISSQGGKREREFSGVPFIRTTKEALLS